jgi:hypothetical protein
MIVIMKFFPLGYISNRVKQVGRSTCSCTNREE